jgi:hypothetical protein
MDAEMASVPCSRFQGLCKWRGCLSTVLGFSLDCTVLFLPDVQGAVHVSLTTKKDKINKERRKKNLDAKMSTNKYLTRVPKDR